MNPLDVLARAVRRHLERLGPRPGAFERIEGLEAIDKLIVVDQSPIGRTPRSTPATYTGVFDEIRKVFAKTKEARLRGFTARRFGFTSAEGRCPECRGYGTKRIEMKFLPDVHVVCPACGGRRFNPQTLTVTFRDLRFMYDTSFIHGREDPPLSGTVTLDAARHVTGMEMNGRKQR